LNTQQPQSPPEYTDIVMRLSGSGGREFLHGQTTADFSDCGVGSFRYAAFCNPKGRVLADVLAVITDEQEVLLRGRATVMAALAEHLKPYLGFSRCSLTPTDWRIGCRAGSADEDHAGLHFAEASLEAVTVPMGPKHTECWTAPNESEDGDQSDPLWLEIKNQRARIENQTIGSYLPQDLDYDCNGTVSFTKGCYTGQEIVARLHYRGTPKRRLHRAETNVPVVAGDMLINAAGKTVGSIVNHCIRDQTRELLIELVPEAAPEPITLRGGHGELSQVTRCHDDSDQSTG
jgi:folate-binding protein YgfZ